MTKDIAMIEVGSLVRIVTPASVRTGYNGVVIETAKGVERTNPVIRYRVKFSDSNTALWYWDYEVAETSPDEVVFSVGDLVQFKTDRNIYRVVYVYESTIDIDLLSEEQDRVVRSYFNIPAWDFHYANLSVEGVDKLSKAG